MPITAFKPTRHGFHFSNQFVNRIVDIPGLQPITTRGRCGGMAYAALDYYFAGIPIPTHFTQDFPSGGVPKDGTGLSDYIYGRLYRSIVDGGINFLLWTLYSDEDRLPYKGVTRLTKEEELPKLRRQIDAGRPVALGLIQATNLFDIGDNHQVVAYGYDYQSATDRMAVYIYDNNYPDRNDVALVTDSSNPHLYEEIGGQVVTTWRGLFVQSYEPEVPKYKDIVLSKNIWVSSWAPFLGETFQCRFTIRNAGDYAAHVRWLRLHLTDPDGQTMDHFLEPHEIDAPLLPDEERTVAMSFIFPSEKTGMYTVSALYCTVLGEWVSIPNGDSSIAMNTVVNARRDTP